MSLLKFLIATSLLILATERAKADTVFVACYAPESQLQLSFDPESAGFTYVYQKGGLLEQFAALPEGWAKAHSSVGVSFSEDSARLTAQITGGDAETPLIDTTAEVLLAREKDSGTYVMQRAVLYHGAQFVSLQEFIGQPCYVQ